MAERLGMRLSGIAAHVPKETWSNARVAARLRLERMRLASRLRQSGRSLTAEESKSFTTSDRWIRRFVGFTERRFCPEGEGTIDLALRASRLLLERTGCPAADVDAILFASVTPTHLYSPPDAALLQHALGIPAWRDHVPRELKGADVSLACSSWTAALALSYALIRAGMARNVLLVGADRMSATINWRDRSFATVLGDAGTAALCSATPADEDWFAPEGFWSWMDGSRADLILTPEGGSRAPHPSARDLAAGRTRLAMDGAGVRKTMVPFMGGPALDAALAKAGWSPGDLDVAVLHEANPTLNESIVRLWRERGFRGRVLNGEGRFGNTTSASIPLVLALHGGTLAPGARLGLFAFGGGLSASFALATVRAPLPAWTDTA